MERVLARKLPGSGHPKVLSKTIRAWADKGEFKAEELDRSGLDGWLKGRAGKFTMREILDWLATNNVQVKEILKGGAQGDETEHHDYQIPGG